MLSELITDLEETAPLQKRRYVWLGPPLKSKSHRLNKNQRGKKKECAQANLDLEAKVQSKKRYSLVQSLTLKLDPNGEDMGA